MKGIKERLSEGVAQVLTARRLAVGLLVLGALLLLGWGAYVAWHGYSLWGNLRTAQTLLEGDPLELLESDLDMLGEWLRDTRSDVVALRRQVGGLAPLGRSMGWLPKIGPLLAQAEPLLELADGLTEAGVLVWEGYQPLVEDWQRGALAPEKAAAILEAARPQTVAARRAVTRAAAARRRLEPARWPWRMQQALQRFDVALPLLQDGLAMAEIAPGLAGMAGARTYLILVQNDDELRPTGGFITGVGLIEMHRGRVNLLGFEDANVVDDYARKPYPAPPAPLGDYMGLGLWLLRDANWSPDFPTSARQAAYFFEYGREIPVDGVLALNQYALDLFMQGFGPVEVAGVSEPITAANIRDLTREAWNPGDEGVTRSWTINRKDFIGEWANALFSRFERDPGSLNWPALARFVWQALDTRQLLIYVEDPIAAQVLAALQWDGALRAVEGDYLMVVDANMGYGKVNVLIEPRIEYAVALQADGTGTAELALTYTHRGRRRDVPCEHFFIYTGQLAYEDMIHRCYYNYVRVLAPAGSDLHSATPWPTPGEFLLRGIPDAGEAVVLEDEVGKVVFAQFFVVEYGKQLTTRFEYVVPGVVQGEGPRRHYSLLVQKQPGTGDVPVTVAVTLPPGAQFISASSSPANVLGSTMVFELTLKRDLVLEVIFE